MFPSIWRRRLLLFGRAEEAPLREGNAVALYTSGGDLLAAAREAMRAARRSIDVEMYIWADDEVGGSFADLAAEALARGVRVRVLYDAVGCIGRTAHLDRLAAAGARVEVFHRLTRFPTLHRRNHRKLLIVDDTVAVLGGANWSNDYDSARDASAFFDVGIGIAGPAVEDLCADFRRVFRMEQREPLPPADAPRPDLLPSGRLFRGVPAQVVSGFRRGERSTIHRLYGMLLKSAASRILVANSYFVPGPRLARLFARAARRGVEVKLLLPGHSDVPIVKLAARATYGRLLRAGVRIYERQGRMVHAKVAVIDREVAVVGTANLDVRSLRFNLELNVNVHDADLAAALEECVVAELRESREVHLEAWSLRPFPQRAVERFLYWLRSWL